MYQLDSKHHLSAECLPDNFGQRKGELWYRVLQGRGVMRQSSSCHTICLLAHLRIQVLSTKRAMVPFLYLLCGGIVRASCHQTVISVHVNGTGDAASANASSRCSPAESLEPRRRRQARANPLAAMRTTLLGKDELTTPVHMHDCGMKEHSKRGIDRSI